MPSSTDGDAVEHGRLVSIEGLNGVGKTYLTTRVIKAAADRGEQPPQVIEEFSSRAGTNTDLGRRLLRTLISAANGERFRLLDRRQHDADALVDIITAWIAGAPARPFHGLVPTAAVP